MTVSSSDSTAASASGVGSGRRVGGASSSSETTEARIASSCFDCATDVTEPRVGIASASASTVSSEAAGEVEGDAVVAVGSAVEEFSLESVEFFSEEEGSGDEVNEVVVGDGVAVEGTREGALGVEEVAGGVHGAGFCGMIGSPQSMRG